MDSIVLHWKIQLRSKSEETEAYLDSHTECVKNDRLALGNVLCLELLFCPT